MCIKRRVMIIINYFEIYSDKSEFDCIEIKRKITKNNQTKKIEIKMY